MADSFAMDDVKLDSPATRAVIITPNDSTDLEHVSRSVYVGTEGDLNVTMNDEESDAVTVLFTAAKGFLPLRVRRIWASGTTATGIVAVW